MLKQDLWDFQIEIDETTTAEWYLTSESKRLICQLRLMAM